MKCCSKYLELEVHEESSHGLNYFIGFKCETCRTLKKISGFYQTRKDALKDLHIYRKLYDKPFFSEE